MIEVSHIHKNFGGFEALRDISFSIKKGEIVGFLGPNGAGKTTTMRILTGYTLPTSGKVQIKDIDIAKNPLEARRNIGYLPESNPLYTDFTVEELLDYTAGIRNIRGNERKKAIDSVVEQCSLEEKYYKPISTLSKGYKQRVGLASALIHTPDVLILDEPMSGLDPRQILEIRDLLKKIGKNHTILFSTHIMQEVEAICNKVLIINKGTLVAEGKPKDLSESKENTSVMHIHICAPAKDSKEFFAEEYTIVNSRKVKDGVVEISIQIDSDISKRTALFHYIYKKKIPAIAIIPEEHNLEDTFLSLTT